MSDPSPVSASSLQTQSVDPSGVSDQAESQGFSAIPELSNAIANRAPSIATRTGLARAPFVFTRIGRKEGIYEPSGGPDFAFIYAELNPTQYSFTLKTREVLEKCGGGEVLHSFPASAERAERLGKYIDEVPFNYTMTTGNCIPVKGGEDGNSILIPGGLDTLYALQELLFEDPRVLPDGRSNDLIVIQTSLVFPQIVVTGKLDPGGIQGLNLDAQNPAEIRGYSFTISAREISPRITDHAALQAAYIEAEFGQAS